MPKDTTPLGQVGKPTRTTLADTSATSKKDGTPTAPLYFDHLCTRGDDFDEMVDKGLAQDAAQNLRRISHGLSGIREITNLLYILNVEQHMRDDAEDEDKGQFNPLSPIAAERVARGVHVLSELLGEEVHRLGTSLVAQAMEGGAQ